MKEIKLFDYQEDMKERIEKAFESHQSVMVQMPTGTGKTILLAEVVKSEKLKGKKLQYAQLEELPIMCLEGTTSTRNYVESFLKENDVVLHPEFELATSNMLIQFAVKGLGIASVVKDFAEDYLKTGELFLLEFEKRIPSREICVVADERIPMSAAAQQLLNMIER